MCRWTQPEAHAFTTAKLLELLETPADGLSSREAAHRLTLCGPNRLATRRERGWWSIAWEQIRSPLVWVLLVAGLLAAWMGRPTDGMVISLVVILNTSVGIFQDLRASQALAALQDLVPRHCRVLRGGQRLQLDAETLVPGDLVLLAAGDQIPADLRILEAQGLRVVEAALTGESVAIDKRPDEAPAAHPLAERAHMLWSGSLVVAGTGMGVVVATGLETELGRISRLLGSVQAPMTPLSRTLHHFGNRLTLFIGLVALILFAIGLWRGVALSTSLLSAVTLAVAAIPEGLPALVTMILAVGVHRMAQHQAVVRDLPAVEALGSTTVICTDKTGTLTQNIMAVVEAWQPDDQLTVEARGYAPEPRFPDHLAANWRELATVALFCNDATLADENGIWVCHGDPTEGALLAFAARCGLALQLGAEAKRLSQIPFDSEHRLMAVSLQLGPRPADAPRILVKGAVDAVLARCQEPQRELIHEKALEMASRGLRVLALAEGPADPSPTPLSLSTLTHLRVLGLLALEDPPRPEAKQALATCRAAGIRVKMITGDHPATAQAIARTLGLTERLTVMTGVELAALTPAELPEQVHQIDLYARIAPEQKLQLIEMLQAQGEVVAMTGDGVNDGPALRRADIGVAMGRSGTAVAREAADLVLLDDRFVTIEQAVEEGRRIFDNLTKSLAFLLPTNFGLALILLLGLQLMPVKDGEVLLPLTPLQVLWVNLVVAVALALPLAFEPPEPDVMSRPPRDPSAPILSRAQIVKMGIVACWQALVSFLIFFAALDLWGQSEAQAQTLALQGVVLVQIMALLDSRSRARPAWSSLRSNPWILRGIALLVALQTLITLLPALQHLLGTAVPSLAACSLLLGAALPQLVWSLLKRRSSS